jgi:hypothetical protein
VALKNILAETLADALRRLLAVEPFFGSFVYTSLFLLTPVHHQKTQPTTTPRCSTSFFSTRQRQQTDLKTEFKEELKQGFKE